MVIPPSAKSFYADDLTDDARWPDFGTEAVGDAFGALNLYASYPRAFGVVDRARGLLLAALAALALTSAESQESDARATANLKAALVTREVIGQAQGILMERERITGDAAFEVLRRASQHLNIKLHDVAETLIETGERPDTGPLTP